MRPRPHEDNYFVATKRQGLMISTVAQQPVPVGGRCGCSASVGGILQAMATLSRTAAARAGAPDRLATSARQPRQPGNLVSPATSSARILLSVHPAAFALRFACSAALGTNSLPAQSPPIYLPAAVITS